MAPGKIARVKYPSTLITMQTCKLKIFGRECRPRWKASTTVIDKADLLLGMPQHHNQQDMDYFRDGNPAASAANGLMPFYCPA
jgi:hypothetical protein